MEFFARDDGRNLRVVERWRERVLAAPRVSVQPKPEWRDDDFRAAADKKVRHAERFTADFSRHGGVLEGARALEVGCGAGIDSLLFAMHPVGTVDGIDMELPLFAAGEAADRTRRLAREVFAMLQPPVDVDVMLRQRPVRFETMDATRMTFADDSFDLL